MSGDLLLGLGGTVDYEIEWNAAVLESLARGFGVRVAELDPATPILDERSLVVSVLSFLRDGRGGERFVPDTAVLERFASRFRYATTLGGTCVRAALAMSRLSVPSTVHLVSIDDTVRRLLPADVSTVSSATEDSTDPHVIVQYPAGAVIRLEDAELVAPHPNRLIYVNDLPNRELVLSEDLDTLVARSRVFLASGFNTIQDEAILEDRLARTVRAIGGRAPGAVAMFEDAGSHEVAFGIRVRDVLAPVVDVYSLNEDELFGYLGGAFDLLDAAAVAEALAQAREVIPARILVVHTKHWAAAAGPDATQWRAALEGGVTMAGTRFRVGDALTADEYAQTQRMPRQADAAILAAVLEEWMPDRIAVVPAFALDPTRATTIGLGDTFVGGFVAALAESGIPGRVRPA